MPVGGSGGVWLLVALLGVMAMVWGVLALRHGASLREFRRGMTAVLEGRPIRPIQPMLGGATYEQAKWFNDMAPALQRRMQGLEEDGQQLEAVLGAMTEGVLAIDSRRRLVFANPAARSLFRLDADAGGRLVAEVIRNPQIQAAVERSMAGGPVPRAEITMPGPDILDAKHDRTLSVQGTPLPGSPPPGAVLVFHDVTELRRLERMRQDFVANASHELKTPLAAIKINAETLLDWGLHDDTVNVMLLRQIDEMVDRLNALVHDMLSLARLESGQEAYRHEPVALAPLLIQGIAPHEPRARSQGIQLETSFHQVPDLARVRIAEEAFHQILNNLIDNAIKYTPGGGRVRVAARVHQGQFILVVTDTGPGIPREDLPRIFERFYRVDKARSRSLGGTGLGLSIVKNLVQSVGGQVAVESHLGVGSTFTIRLPVILDPHTTDALNHARSSGSSDSHGPLTPRVDRS